MKLFKLNNTYSVVCDSKGTRSGFKHIASLLRNGSEINKTKICYLNRTWEGFTYETVLLKAIDLFFVNEKEVKKFKAKIKANMGY